MELMLNYSLLENLQIFHLIMNLDVIVLIKFKVIRVFPINFYLVILHYLTILIKELELH